MTSLFLMTMRHHCRRMGGVTDWSAARTQLLGLVGRNDKAFAKSAGIGDTLDALPGNRVGPTKQGTKDLIALDPNATIDSNGVITGSCCAESPRVVAIAVYDPQEYAAAGYPKGSTFSLTIVNILSMFIKSVDANSKITGVFIEKSDDLDEGSAAPGPITGTSFLTMVRLVR